MFRTSLDPSVRTSPLNLLLLLLRGRVGFDCYVVSFVSAKFELIKVLTYFG